MTPAVTAAVQSAVESAVESAVTVVSEPVLAGVCVVEISSGHAAGLAGHYLLGYGAEVIRFALEPSWLSPDVVSYVHKGKGSAPAEDLGSLLAWADVVVCDANPGALQRLGIDWAEVRKTHPTLVVVSVTAFGLHGTYVNFEHTNATAFALGGIMSLTGDADRGPLVTGGSHAYALAGLHAFAAATTGLVGVRAHGNGEFFDLSGQECAAAMLEYYGPHASYTGERIRALGNHTRATWAIYPCADGWAGIFALERQVPALFAMLDDPDLSSPRFRDPLLRRLPENEEELTAKLYVWLSDKSMEVVREIGLRTRVPIGTATIPSELLNRPGLTERNAFEASGAPARPFPGFPWSIAESEPATNVRAKTAAVAERNAATADPSQPLPLARLRVIDLTMMWAGPFATLRLAEMGADVIKVESPSAWDNIRTLLPIDAPEPWNSSYYFNAYNRAKRSLTLDLAQEEGRKLLLRLVKSADVLIENYRADVLDKLGLSVELLLGCNPQLVIVSMAAFGKIGADRNYVGFGPVIEMLSGLTALTGYGDGEPFKTGLSYGDPVAGTAAVAAVNLGILQRYKTSLGCWVDLAQREVAMTLAGEAFLAAQRGEAPAPKGCRDSEFAPQNAYPCDGDQEWVVISIRSDAQWKQLCAHIALPSLVALSHLSHDERLVRLDEIDALIGSWTSRRTNSDVMSELQSLGVAAGAVRHTLSILDDDNLVSRRFWCEYPHPRMHTYRQQGPLWGIAKGDRVAVRHAPLFGEHNREILVDELGLSEVDLARLASSHVIADAPLNPGVG